MTYAEALRENYREAHRRLWGLPAPTIKVSGTATGSMWLGIDYDRAVEPATRKGVDIINAVLAVTNVPRNDFMSTRRSRACVEARQLAYWFMRHYTKLSSPQIGRMIGGRDHSTVLHGIHKVSVRADIFNDRIRLISVFLFLPLEAGNTKCG